MVVVYYMKQMAARKELGLDPVSALNMEKTRVVKLMVAQKRLSLDTLYALSMDGCIIGAMD